MEFKGTKGKWEIFIDSVIKSEIFIMTGKIPIIRIAVNNYINKKEAKANALLISKAPEMLEMLKRCEYWISACNEDANILKDISELIKEATEF